MHLIFNIPLLLSIFHLLLKNQLIWAQNRIIGGDRASIEDFPYMLNLVIPRVHSHKASFCGAGIISKEWAVTAAHCFLNPDRDPDRIRVHAGTADLKRREKTAKTYKVVEYIQHELFKGIGTNQRIEGDIAVIKISPPLTYNDATQPLKLPEEEDDIERSFATIAGWGKTDPKGKGTTKLRYVRLPEVDTNHCRREYRRHHNRVHEGEICYGFHNETVTLDKCEGDSGGPLVNDDNIVLGVVSKGVKCGEHGLPGIYTDVLFFRDWIRNKTGV